MDKSCPPSPGAESRLQASPPSHLCALGGTRLAARCPRRRPHPHEAGSLGSRRPPPSPWKRAGGRGYGGPAPLVAMAAAAGGGSASRRWPRPAPPLGRRRHRPRKMADGGAAPAQQEGEVSAAAGGGRRDRQPRSGGRPPSARDLQVSGWGWTSRSLGGAGPGGAECCVPSGVPLAFPRAAPEGSGPCAVPQPLSLPVGAAPPSPGRAGPLRRGCRLFFLFPPLFEAGKEREDSSGRGLGSLGNGGWSAWWWSALQGTGRALPTLHELGFSCT